MNTRKAPSDGANRLERTGSAASSLGAALGLIFLPKCPLCIAAYLASFGLSAGVTAIAAPLVRPLAVTLLLMALAVLFRNGWRRRKPLASEQQGHAVNCCC